MIGPAIGRTSRMNWASTNPSGTRVIDSTGATYGARLTSPPAIASGPFVGATPPSTPTPCTRSGSAAPAASA